MGYSPWGHKELDMTERLTQTKNVFFGEVCFQINCHFLLLLDSLLHFESSLCMLDTSSLS